MTQYALLILAAAFCAGLLQGVTGMGGGMLMMLVLPHIFPVPQAAAVSGAICLFLTFLMLLRYHSFISFRIALLPTFLYLAASLTAISLSVEMNWVIIRKVFGGFLILLSLYFIFWKDKSAMAPGKISAVLFPVVSGICDGLFGIGSPLMVLYFTDMTHSKEEYLGTIQFLFFITLFANTALRLTRHLISLEHFPGILLGFLGIIGGIQVANRIVGKITGETLKQFAYCAIGISGLYNLFI